MRPTQGREHYYVIHSNVAACFHKDSGKLNMYARPTVQDHT